MFVFDNVFLCWGLSYVLCRRPSSRVRPQHRHGLGLGLLDQREQRTALQLGQWEGGWSHGLRQNHEAWRQQGRVRRERQRWQWAGCWWAWWRQSWGWSVGVTVVGVGIVPSFTLLVKVTWHFASWWVVKVEVDGGNIWATVAMDQETEGWLGGWVSSRTYIWNKLKCFIKGKSSLI